MKLDPSHNNSVSDSQALALDEGVATLLRRFKLEPSLIAGSPYADLHANDVGLLVVLRESGKWSVRRIAQELGAPISTISSALDRLEKRGLLTRLRQEDDRRVVHIALTPAGQRLVKKIRGGQIETCRAMLARLNRSEREQLIRLVARVAHG
jgi:DNA-binding MarR family transcriptional regulator